MALVTLYHFTARRFLADIRRQGLTRGVLLVRTVPVTFRGGWQWLTSNPDPAGQTWARGTGILPYSRTEVRLTVDVPPGHEDLQPWSRVRFLVPEVAELLSEYGDPENWWLFNGAIPPAWITAVDDFRASIDEAEDRAAADILAFRKPCRLVCAWCGAVMREGPEPTSHGMCGAAACRLKFLAGFPHA